MPEARTAVSSLSPAIRLYTMMHAVVNAVGIVHGSVYGITSGTYLTSEGTGSPSLTASYDAATTISRVSAPTATPNDCHSSPSTCRSRRVTRTSLFGNRLTSQARPE